MEKLDMGGSVVAVVVVGGSKVVVVESAGKESRCLSNQSANSSVDGGIGVVVGDVVVGRRVTPIKGISVGGTD